jgi:hypothetical protein
MTTLIDRADARWHASIMMKSSMRFSLTGELVGYTKNISQAFTLLQLHINPSTKCLMRILPRSTPDKK